MPISCHNNFSSRMKRHPGPPVLPTKETWDDFDVFDAYVRVFRLRIHGVPIISPRRNIKNCRRWIEESTGMNLLKGCWNTSWRSDRCTERMIGLYIYMYTVCIRIRYVLMILLLMFYQFIACVYSNIYTEDLCGNSNIYIYIHSAVYIYMIFIYTQ